MSMFVQISMNAQQAQAVHVLLTRPVRTMMDRSAAPATPTTEVMGGLAQISTSALRISPRVPARRPAPTHLEDTPVSVMMVTRATG